MTSTKYVRLDSLSTKTTDYLRYSTALFRNPHRLKDIVSREIEICKMLRKHPHANTCRYQGADYETPSQCITALLSERYDTTLSDLVSGRHAFDASTCVSDIQRGSTHIHSLGYAHCDTKPEDIFVDIRARTAARFVVGDFDSMQRQGSRLEDKCGTQVANKTQSHHQGTRSEEDQSCPSSPNNKNLPPSNKATVVKPTHVDGNPQQEAKHPPPPKRKPGAPKKLKTGPL